jgi:hypothetical protein
MATEAKNPTVDELEAKEEELFRTGPLSVLTTSVKSNSQARATTFLYNIVPANTASVDVLRAGVHADGRITLL